MTALLEIKNLSARYGAIVALKNVSVTVNASEAVALVGANGAGKSTLMKSIMGMVSVEGAIEFQSRDISTLDPASRAHLGLGYSPEGRRVFPGMTVKENLEVASFANAAVTHERVERVLTLFPGLKQKFSTLGWQLSGGQQQMLAIGRALMNSPKLLLLDEPSLGLSPKLTTDVLERVADIVKAGTSVLLAEQNVARALNVCQRAYVLQVGHVLLEGDARVIRDDPMIKTAFLGG
jgi:branched-chain amino acid transport system ATP-binding protein